LLQERVFHDVLHISLTWRRPAVAPAVSKNEQGGMKPSKGGG
jgi:hypothetical protein